MQRIVNYGSFLQAYALKSVVEALGHKVVFVDYRVEDPIIKDSSIEEKYCESNFVFLLKYFAKKILNIPLDSYYTHKMTLRKIGVTEKRHYNTKTDVLIIGSDEVFNCLQPGPNVGYSLELFGKNNRAKRLITYAASFGYTTSDGLRKYGKYDEIKNYINKFDTISVRDDNSMSIVSEMGIENAVMHLDPVLIYDFSGKIIEKKDINDYILIYSYAGRMKNEDEIRKIKEFAKKHGKKTVSVGNHQPWTDVKLPGNAFELLGYIKNADYVVTDTFHGTIFSIIMKKQFATLIRDSNRQKLSSLLNTLFLNDRIVQRAEDIENVLLKRVDYQKTDAVINRERQRTLEYLKNNII